MPPGLLEKTTFIITLLKSVERHTKVLITLVSTRTAYYNLLLCKGLLFENVAERQTTPFHKAFYF